MTLTKDKFPTGDHYKQHRKFSKEYYAVDAFAEGSDLWVKYSSGPGRQKFMVCYNGDGFGFDVYLRVQVANLSLVENEL